MIPEHQASLVTITSPLGQLWQDKLEEPAIAKVWQRDFPNISETIEQGETPLEAAVRGILEELNLPIDASRFIEGEVENVEKPSPTDGYMKKYTFHHFSLELTQEEAEAVPLVTRETNRVLYLEWRPIPKLDAPVDGLSTLESAAA